MLDQSSDFTGGLTCRLLLDKVRVTNTRTRPLDRSVPVHNLNMGALFRKLAKGPHDNHNSRLGIANTMRLASAYNGLKFRRQLEWRRKFYQSQLSALL